MKITMMVWQLEYVKEKADDSSLNKLAFVFNTNPGTGVWGGG